MELRWTREAAADLERIADYLFQHAPDRAADLLEFPHRGRPGKKEGTRELVLSPLPYLVVYAVRSDVIFVVRILHGAQQWP